MIQNPNCSQFWWLYPPLGSAVPCCLGPDHFPLRWSHIPDNEPDGEPKVDCRRSAAWLPRIFSTSAKRFASK
jgi:hypothetical protein